MAYKEEVQRLALDERIPWDSIDGSRVVITGSTGLIGGMIANAILSRNSQLNTQTALVLPVRNIEKARNLFAQDDLVDIQYWDASSGTELDAGRVDFIIHCASNTNSRLMIERPVDTIMTTVNGAISMLSLARENNARMVFVSSMEVYGRGSEGTLDETRGGELDSMNVRSSYPQSKQLSENLCACYASQYDVNVCVARLAQSFGPGIADSDKRVFAEFARCCLAGDDIKLLTDGSKSNMYVYNCDAIRALLTLVVRGAKGEAYNVANEETFCSIYEMAQMVASEFGTTTEVTRVVDELAAKRYAASGRLFLDTSKMRAIGWVPDVGLTEMYRRMIDDWSSR